MFLIDLGVPPTTGLCWFWDKPINLLQCILFHALGMDTFSKISVRAPFLPSREGHLFQNLGTGTFFTL